MSIHIKNIYTALSCPWFHGQWWSEKLIECFSDTQRSRIEWECYPVQHYCLHTPFCWIPTSTANYNHHLLFTETGWRYKLHYQAQQKRDYFIFVGPWKNSISGVEERKANLKSGYNDRMKKAGRYWRQKFGRVEHKNVFSHIYNVSKDLSPSFVLLSRPQWKPNKMKTRNKNQNKSASVEQEVFQTLDTWKCHANVNANLFSWMKI